MKKEILVLVAMIMAVLGIACPAYAGNCPAGSRNATYTNSVAECNMETTGNNSASGVTNTLNIVVNVALGILGLVTVIMIIVGGYMYVTSSGDMSKVTKAKNTIMYGIVGLIIALLAWAIVNFVLANVFSGSSSGQEQNNKGSAESSRTR